jgi:hypothetical protein
MAGIIGKSTKTIFDGYLAGGADRTAEQTTRQPKPLTVRLRGDDVELTCMCGLVLVQPLRAVITDQCPRCRRRWRR